METRIPASRDLGGLLDRYHPMAGPNGRPTWHPRMDVKLTRREMELFIDLPGVDEDEIDMELLGDVLVVRGCREFDHDKEDAEDFSRIERPFGQFECRAMLAAGCRFDEATAKYRRGVLKVRIPRRSENLPGAGGC